MPPSLRKRIYLWTCLTWIGYVLLIPNWVGISYSYDDITPGFPIGRQGTWGSWGLLDGQSPLFAPPAQRRNTDGPHNPIRWPWEFPNSETHVEIRWSLTLARLFAGMIVLGVPYIALCWTQRDAFFWIVVLTVIESVMVLAVMEVMAGLGGMDTAPFAWITLMVATSVNLGVAARCYPGLRIWLSALKDNFQLSRREIGTSSNRSAADTGSDMAGFAIGLMAAMATHWLTGLVVVLLRGRQYFKDGPPPNYEVPSLYESFANRMDIVGGLAIIAFGLSLGRYFWLRSKRRGFAAGLLISSVLLGIAFVFRY